MPDRSAEEIRLEIATERQRLADDVVELRREARSVVPVAAAGLVAVAVLSHSGTLVRAAKRLWRLH
jgi:hypothetical protein